MKNNDVSSITPPAARTHLGLEMTRNVVSGELHLQQCAQCDTVQYPPRELCVQCLSSELTWRDVGAAGVVQASTALHHSLDPWFSERTPWHMGSVKLACGPMVLAHLAPDVLDANTAVWVLGIKDTSGQAVLVAVSQSLSVSAADAYAHKLLNDEKTT